MTFHFHSTDPIQADHVVTLDHFEKEDGYYIFYKGTTTPVNVNSVVMLTHGYGALNPAIFGAWIEHLIQNRNVVVYPRYQKNLISPAATKFTENATRAWKDAVKELDSLGFRDYPVVFTGHSFGGVIVSNMVSLSEETGIRLPDAVLVAEGGTGPFTSALLDNYSNVPSEIPFIIVAGEHDWTVGATFGTKLFQELPVHGEHHFIYQRRVQLANGRTITASHYEPYSIDDWCDNGLHNLTYKRANRVGKIDEMNQNGYWYWLDLLIERTSTQGGLTVDKDLLKKSMFEAIGPVTDSCLLIANKLEVGEP